LPCACLDSFSAAIELYQVIIWSHELAQEVENKNISQGRSPEDRCRLVLVVPAIENAFALLENALSGGDVASIILMRKDTETQQDLEEGAYQDHCQRLCELAQEKNVAALVETDSQIFGRSGADGIFIPSGLENLKEAIARFSPKSIVGYGGVRTRHNAMDAGELSPDFLFLGRLDGDIKPEAHPKNVALAGWCNEVMQMSVVVMGGSALESVVEIAECGAEFAALGSAVFKHGDGPAKAVSLVNQLLEQHSPLLDDGS
jgi:thiamine-phosphate pyrophosphorylase